MREIKRKNLEGSHHGRQWSRLFYVCRGIIRMLDRAIPSYRSAIKVVAKYLRLSMEEEREGREGEREVGEKRRERDFRRTSSCFHLTHAPLKSARERTKVVKAYLPATRVP